MSLLNSIRKNIIVTEPSETDLAYDCGYLAATFSYTKSLRATAGMACVLLACEAVVHIVIPTVTPLIQRGWVALKGVISSRSFVPDVTEQQEVVATAN